MESTPAAIGEISDTEKVRVVLFVNGRLAHAPLGALLEHVTASLWNRSAPAAKTTSTTLTASEFANGMITANQGAGATADYTLPTGSALETELDTRFSAALAVGQFLDFIVINISTNAAEDVTILTNTGWTLVGEMTVEANDNDRARSAGVFRARRTAANTYTLYRIS